MADDKTNWLDVLERQMRGEDVSQFFHPASTVTEPLTKAAVDEIKAKFGEDHVWQREYLGMWHELDPAQKIIRKGVIWYLEQTEDFDRSQCHLQDDRGCGMPTTLEERVRCTKNAEQTAKMARQQIIEALGEANLPVNPEEIMKGFRHYKIRAQVRWSDRKQRFIVNL